jgi:hypothetical protein
MEQSGGKAGKQCSACWKLVEVRFIYINCYLCKIKKKRRNPEKTAELKFMVNRQGDIT